MTEPLLEVKGLKTYFQTTRGIARAVDGVSFSLERGKTLALVGESGCGKSVTALSIIQLVPEPAGFIAGGEVRFKGRNIVPLSKEEKRRLRGADISMIFQEPLTSLNPTLTVGSQVMESLLLHKTGDRQEARRLAEQMLVKVGLPDPVRRMNEYPHQLSGGMRQRVMIAIALACEPDVLIADEPTTALDVTIQAQILRLMRKLQQEMGMSMLLITHDLGVVCENADDVAVMYAGKIVEQSPRRDLFVNPKHPYTQGLLGSLPSQERRGGRLHAIQGTVPSPTRFPSGCRFHPRCPHVMPDRCPKAPPGQAEVGPDHTAACYLYLP